MRHHVRAPLCALAAACLLGVAVTQAGAVALSVSNTSFRAVWTTFTGEGGFSTVRCPLTLEGSFHARTLVKVAGNLIGYVNRASSGTCTGGTLRLLTETLPWHVQYSSFSGTLPSITTANISTVGTSFSVRESVFGITCLFRSTAESPATLSLTREAGGVITSASAGGTLPENGCGAGATARLSGSATVTLAGSATTRISLTLIEVALGALTSEPREARLEGRAGLTLTLRNTDAASGITIVDIQERAPFRYTEEARCRVGALIPPLRTCRITVTNARLEEGANDLVVTYALRAAANRMLTIRVTS